LAKPIIDVGNGSMGFGAVIPRMANSAIDFTHHMWVHGLDGAIHCSFLVARSSMCLSTKPSGQSTKGYAQGSDLSVDRCVSYELDGDARHNEVFIQVRPLWGRNTYVLRLICIVVYNEMCFEGVPCPPYIVRRPGLQIWKLILPVYNCHSWLDKDSYPNRPRSCLISKFAFLPCVGRRADRLGHASSFDGTGPLVWASPSLAIGV
jgi:hypothetical protein